ncbi:MAG: sigma 54-interacting transcriptional regulator [Desulfobacterales bacterium]
MAIPMHPPRADRNRPLIIASLFEGRFSIDWLLEITGLTAEQLLLSIEKAVDDGILVKQGPGRYMFTDSQQRLDYHALLMPEEKGRYSRLITRLLLREPVDETEAVDTVANHLLKVPNSLEGCRRLLTCGDTYRRSNRHKEATHCYRKVITDLKRDNTEEADRLVIDAALGYSRVSDAETDLRSVTSALNDAISRAQKHDSKSHAAMLKIHLAMTNWMLFDFKSAFRHFNQGYDIAKEIDDPSLRYAVNAFTSLFLFYQGRFKEVVKNYEDIAPVISKYPKTRTAIHAAFVTGCAYAYTGDLTQGMGLLNALYNDNKNKGDLYVESTLSLAIGWILLEINDIDNALLYLEEAGEKAAAAPHYITLLFCLDALAAAYIRKKDVGRASEYLKKCLDLCNNINFETYQLFNLLEIYWHAGQENISGLDHFSVDAEIQRAVLSRDIRNKGVAYRYQGILRRQKGQTHQKVIQSLLLSIKWLKEAGHRTQLAKTRVELAREYISKGSEDRGRKEIVKIAGDVDLYGNHLVPRDMRFLLEKRREEKDLFKEMIKLGQELVMIRDYRELVRHIISTANRITGAERGAIFVLDEGASTTGPTLRAATNLNEADVSHPDFTDSKNMIRKSLATETGVFLNREPSESDGRSSIPPIRNCICVPMKIRGGTVGVLYHDNRFFPSRFKEKDLEILSYFAAQAAIAMDNAGAYEEIKSLNEILKQENEYYEEQHIAAHHFEEIVGESGAVKEVIAKVIQVAQTDSNILILGETGVGKELVARAIHRRSSRKDKPFVSVNCSAFPESLIASELFGHEKGAFTGASHQRTGRFELAHNGTIFIDEIGEISKDVQVRLLRVLQSKEFERLGGKKTLYSNFRLITATNSDLVQDVRSGKFREDLYYRLNVFPIVVPPLRKRREDIPLLAYYFLDIYAQKLKKKVMKITDADMQKLIQYDWPGNVRELENVIERGVILSAGARFKIPELIYKNTRDTTESPLVTFAENERRHIIRVLKITGGVIHGKGGAAEILDVHPNTLYSKMKKLGIRKHVSVG